MISPNARLSEQVKIVNGFGGATPSTSTPDYVSLKNYDRVCVLVTVKNGTVVTGSAISLKQAQAVANTGEKALAFSTARRSLNTGGGGNTDALSSFDVASNTFTTNTTNSLDNLYEIDVQATDLDLANGFDCVRVAVGDAANCVVNVTYILYPPKFLGASMQAAITD